MNVLDGPLRVSDRSKWPPQPAGARVWIAAPLVPALRATAVATAEMLIVCPEPSTCMIDTGIEWVTVTAKLTPAIALLVTLMLSCWPHGSLKLQLAASVPSPEQVAEPYSASLLA